MTLQKFLRAIIVGGCFALLVSPLIVANSLFFPFITGKAFFFRFIVEILFAAWLILMVVDGSVRPRRSLLLWALSLFVVVVTAATIFSVNPSRSFWSNFERMEGLVTYLHLFAYWLVLVSIFKTEKLWRRLFNFSLGVSVIVVGYSFLQLLGALAIHQGGVRVDATLGNAIYLAVYLLIHIGLACYLMAEPQTSRSWRYAYGVLAFFQLLALYYTATRGAVLGLVVGFFVTTILLIWRGRGAVSPRLRRNLAISLGAVIILGAGFWAIRQAPFVQKSPVLSRFAGISLKDQTTEARLTIWQMSLKGFTEHPVLGWGPDNYNLVFNKYYDPTLWNQEQWFDRSHNIFLDWLISAGVLGLASYLSLFVISFYYIWQRRKAFSIIESSILAGLLVAYFIHNIFVFDNLISYIFFFSLLGYLHVRAVSREAGPVKLKPTGLVLPWQWLVAGVVGVGLVVVLYTIEYRPYAAAYGLVQALNIPNAEARLAQFTSVLDRQTFGNAEAREQLVSSTYQVLNTPNVASSTKVAYVQKTINEFETQLQQTPNDARYAFFYGSFLAIINQLDQALVVLNKAHELSPNKQPILFELADVYAEGGDFKNAVMEAKTAYDLDPSYPEARRVYALVLFADKQTTKALELIHQSLPDGSKLELDDRFINSLAAAKAFDDLLALWQAKVKADDNNIDNHFHLAASYLAVGERDKAIAELQLIATRAPDQKATAEHLINVIEAGGNPLPQ